MFNSLANYLFGAEAQREAVKMPMLPEEKAGVFSIHRLYMTSKIDVDTLALHDANPSVHRCRIGKITLKTKA